MIERLLAIAVILAVAFVLYLAYLWLLRDRDEDSSPFNWDGTVPAAPGQCSCGAPHARTLAPFPPETVPALPEMIAAPVAAPPAARVDTAALVDELAAGVWGHGGDTAAAEESNWHKADGERLAGQIRDGAL